jgi:thiosulfate/3-mercaptopyruvate sulfurtransferase
MARIIRCECGHVARGDSDEAVVTAIRPGPWKACSSARVSIPARRWCATAMPLLAFWLMKLYRHADVRVLDCSRRAWTNDERPWTTDAPTPNPTTRYPLLRRMPAFRADYATVRAAIDGGSRCPKPGRVPGRAVLAVRSTRAVWSRRAHSLRHSPADRQRPRRTRPVPFRRRTPPAVRTDRRITVGDVITYCAIGGRAAIAWFMLTYVLGYPNVRVYDGSWAEWGHSGAAPVTTVACSPAS